MSFIQNRKQKIDLYDYNYSYDVENRLFLSNLTALEVDVLEEIINSSLRISLKHLIDALDLNLKTIEPILEKLSSSKLFQRTGDVLIVDKSKRKYFEAQIIKFQEDFEPGMELLQNLLNNVPIHVLPMWYSIKTSDHIFNSIIEKHLQTPKTYERYLSELNLEDPILIDIYKEVLGAPGLSVKAKLIRDKFHLSNELFHEKMLLLEYNLACCLSYQKINDGWEEVVTPFFEWHDYLTFRNETSPKPIEDVSSVTRYLKEDFGFIHDLASMLTHLQNGQQSFIFESNIPSFTHKTTTYQQSLISRALQLKLIKTEENTLILQPSASEWLQLHLNEQALFMFRQQNNDGASDRDIREIEKSLKPFISKGWIYFDDFLKTFTADIGKAEAISLKNKGKRWKYCLPTYLEDELALIKSTLFGKLFECGMISMGTHQDKVCFCITPLGKVTLG